MDDLAAAIAAYGQALDRAPRERTETSADQVTAILLAREQKPELALLDIRMEGKSGFDVAAYLREVLHIPFLVQMKTSAEMLHSTPEAIQARYREMVADGAQTMLVELCRGVPEANIRAFIEVAREYE